MVDGRWTAEEKFAGRRRRGGWAAIAGKMGTIAPVAVRRNTLTRK